MRVFRIVLLSVLACASTLSPSRAAIVEIQSLIQADFDLTSTAQGEALFGVPEGATLNMQALGNMTFSVDDDGVSTTIPFTNAVGELPGIPPTPFLPFYITPVRFDGGALTNIVRDGSDRIISGTVQNLAMPWELVGTGANTGTVLYGDQATTPLLFSGDITVNYDSGTPRIGVGDFITGADPFNTYLFVSGDRTNQLPGTDPLVFVGSNRVLTAVPEPSSLGLCLLGLGFGVYRRRRS